MKGDCAKVESVFGKIGLLDSAFDVEEYEAGKSRISLEDEEMLSSGLENVLVNMESSDHDGESLGGE